MKILITGSSGFIGSYLIERFKLLGVEVKTLGRDLKNDYTVNLSKEFAEIEESFDLIIHTASIVHKEEHNEKIVSHILLEDFAITLNLIRSIKKTDFSKLIFLSSVAVYGKIKGENIGIDEPLNPSGGYGLSKILAERMIANTFIQNKCLILRLPLVNGLNPKGNLLKVEQSIKSGKMFLLKKNRAQKSIIELEDLFKFIRKNWELIDGTHHIKSYDKEFNQIIKEKGEKGIFEIPLISPKLLISLFSLFRITKLKSTLIKISSTLTFKETIDINE